MSFLKKGFFFLLVALSLSGLASSATPEGYELIRFERGRWDLGASMQRLEESFKSKAFPYVAIDTEFFTSGSKTYLSLVQIQGPSGPPILIDMIRGRKNEKVFFVPRRALRSLEKLLRNEKVKKVFHGGGKDRQLLQRVLNMRAIPNYVDTQVICSYFPSVFQKDEGKPLGLVSYADAVKVGLGVTLEKTEQKSNWKVRPLTEPQKLYASRDVIYLYRLFPALTKKVRETFPPWKVKFIQSVSKETERPVFKPVMGGVSSTLPKGELTAKVKDFQSKLRPIFEELGLPLHHFITRGEFIHMVKCGFSYEDLIDWRKDFFESVVRLRLVEGASASL